MLLVHAFWLLCLVLVSLTAGYPQYPYPSSPRAVASKRIFPVFRGARNETRFAGVNICGFDFGW